VKQHDRDSRELRELCAQRDAARETVRQQSERIAELEAERDQHQTTATALIALLADIRKACGDNGTRMQPELVEFIEGQTRALKVLHTWAGVPGALKPDQTRQLCGKALGISDAARITNKGTE
jgi:uncharacterized coiled-coil DUF342 family protein